MLRERTNRAWFSRLYDIQPGDGVVYSYNPGARTARGSI